MSDAANEQLAPGAQVAEAGDEPLGGWRAPGAGPSREEIAGEAQLSGPGRRRPSSLRSDAAPSDRVPRRRLEPPPLPWKPAGPATAVSTTAGPATTYHPPRLSGEPTGDAAAAQQSQVSGRQSAGITRKMTNPIPPVMDKLPIDSLKTVVRERPEVGLGLAFAGGLVIATLLRRLAR